MKVSSQEKEVVEEAARRINAQIGQFKATYHTQDDLNIAIMACLKFATDMIRTDQGTKQEQEGVLKVLDALENQLTMSLE